MLVLARRVDESIVINKNIEIVIVSVRNSRVQLGIIAPRNISVHRKEIQEEINKEKPNGVIINNTG